MATARLSHSPPSSRPSSCSPPASGSSTKSMRTNSLHAPTSPSSLCRRGPSSSSFSPWRSTTLARVTFTASPLPSPESEALEADADPLRHRHLESSAAVLLRPLRLPTLGERTATSPALNSPTPSLPWSSPSSSSRSATPLPARTIDNLLDAAPTPAWRPRPLPDSGARSSHDLREIPGVFSSRSASAPVAPGPTTFADLTLGIPRNVTFQRSEQITLAATEAMSEPSIPAQMSSSTPSLPHPSPSPSTTVSAL